MAWDERVYFCDDCYGDGVYIVKDEQWWLPYIQTADRRLGVLAQNL